MNNRTLQPVLRHIRRLAGVAEVDPASDRVLLERFAAQHEAASFEVLLERPGAMVQGV